jgi:hypothetical protein
MLLARDTGSYSLMRPPRTARRLTCSWVKSAAGWSGRGWAELAAAVGSSSVVVDLVLGEDAAQVVFAEDEHPAGGGRRAAEQDQPAAKPDEDQVEQAKEHGRSSCPTADRRRIDAAHRPGTLLAPHRAMPAGPDTAAISRSWVR